MPTKPTTRTTVDPGAQTATTTDGTRTVPIPDATSDGTRALPVPEPPIEPPVEPPLARHT
jgi:hypothetical protein